MSWRHAPPPGPHNPGTERPKKTTGDRRAKTRGLGSVGASVGASSYCVVVCTFLFYRRCVRRVQFFFFIAVFSRVEFLVFSSFRVMACAAASSSRFLDHIHPGSTSSRRRSGQTPWGLRVQGLKMRVGRQWGKMWVGDSLRGPGSCEDSIPHLYASI